MPESNTPEIIQMNDFKDFSFKGQKASSFGITRVSSGNRYNENLNPTLKDTTVNITGRDGTVWFDSIHTQRQFKVDFAFDSLTEIQLRQLKVWLNGKDSGELIFDEEPYKAYNCKVTGNATIKYLCFDKTATERIYKGEGSINFTAYEPYAHMPYKIMYNGEEEISRAIIATHYQDYWESYSNVAEWLNTLNLPATKDISTQGFINNGDIPTPFQWKYESIPGGLDYGTEIRFWQAQTSPWHAQIPKKIVIQETTTSENKVVGIKWNSETGLIYKKMTGDTTWSLMRYSGNSLLKINAGNLDGARFTIKQPEATEEDISALIEMRYQFLFY